MTDTARHPFLVALVLVAALSWAGTAASAQRPRPTSMFDSATFAAHTRFLAGDLLEGRGVGRWGGLLAAAYIESAFRTAGLQPGAAGAFLQPVPMESFAPDAEGIIILSRGAARARFAAGEDFAIVNVGEARGVLRAEYRAQTYHTPFDDVRADFDYSGLVQLAEITVALVREIGASRAAAWKSDPELVAMRRPTAAR